MRSSRGISMRRLALNLVRLHGTAAIPLIARAFKRESTAATRAFVAEVLRAWLKTTRPDA